MKRGVWATYQVGDGFLVWELPGPMMIRGRRRADKWDGLLSGVVLAGRQPRPQGGCERRVVVRGAKSACCDMWVLTKAVTDTQRGQAVATGARGAVELIEIRVTML